VVGPEHDRTELMNILRKLKVSFEERGAMFDFVAEATILLTRYSLRRICPRVTVGFKTLGKRMMILF
jgi:hypothetical protein